MAHPIKLEPRTALVTGAASGIGRAVVELLAQRGCACVLVDVQAKALVDVWRSLPGQHLTLVRDLASQAVASALPMEAHALLGPLDLIVHCAGVTTAAGQTIAQSDEASLQRVLDINLRSLQAMGAHAPQALSPTGVMVPVASGAGFRALPLRGAYSASKAGVVAWTSAHAVTWMRRGHGLRAVAPGFVQTAMTQALAQAGALDLDAARQRIPLQRLGQAGDLAEAIWMLATLPVPILQGETLIVDGGSSIAAGSCVPPVPYPLISSSSGESGVVQVEGTSEWAQALEALLNDVEEGQAERGSESSLSNWLGVVDDVSQWSEQLAAMQRLAAACSGRQSPAKFRSLLWVHRAATDEASVVGQASFHMWIKTLALELASAGVRVNAVACGPAIDAGVLAYFLRCLTGPAGAYITGQTPSLGVNP